MADVNAWRNVITTMKQRTMQRVNRVILWSCLWALVAIGARSIKDLLSHEQDPPNIALAGAAIGAGYALLLTRRMSQQNDKATRGDWCVLGFALLGCLFGLAFDVVWRLAQLQGTLSAGVLAFLFGIMFGVLAEMLIWLFRSRIK